MKLDEAFPSPFLKAKELLTSDLSVKISELTIETLTSQEQGEEDQEKATLHFSNHEKMLILNKTNWERIVMVTGEDDSDNWTGKTIILTTEMVNAFGETKPAVRVKMPDKPVANAEAF